MTESLDILDSKNSDWLGELDSIYQQAALGAEFTGDDLKRVPGADALFTYILIRDTNPESLLNMSGTEKIEEGPFGGFEIKSSDIAEASPDPRSMRSLSGSRLVLYWAVSEVADALMVGSQTDTKALRQRVCDHLKSIYPGVAKLYGLVEPNGEVPENPAKYTKLIEKLITKYQADKK